MSRPPRAAVADGDVEIKHHQRILRATRADVAVKILAVGRAEGIPVASGVVGGEHAHPIFHVGDVLQIRDIVRRAGSGRSVHERIDAREIIHRVRRAPNHKIVAITRGLPDTACRREGIQRAKCVVVERNGIATSRVTELEPRLHFVEETIRVVRKVFLHHVAVRRLRVFHQRTPTVAVDIHSDVAAIQPRHAERAQKCVR